MADRLDDTVSPSKSVLRFVEMVRESIRHLTRIDAHASLDEVADAMDEVNADLSRMATLELVQPENLRRTRNPTSGTMNPIAPPMHPRIVDDRIVATVTFNEAYQGPPSVVHGGFVAAVLDEALGRTRHLTDHNVVTGSLTVRYKRPTPINVELSIEAWISEIQERKMISRGKISHGDVVVAEAEGIFVFMKRERFMDLVGEARTRSSIPDSTQDSPLGGHHE